MNLPHTVVDYYRYLVPRVAASCHFICKKKRALYLPYIHYLYTV
jgi:hypothetical protein